jgi:hypothetical protein
LPQGTSVNDQRKRAAFRPRFSDIVGEHTVIFGGVAKVEFIEPIAATPSPAALFAMLANDSPALTCRIC